MRIYPMISVLAMLYAVLTLIWLSMHALAVDIWPVRLWATLLPVNLVTASVAALMLIPRNRWIGLLLALPFTITFAVLYGRYFVPQQKADTTPAPGQNLAVLTFNLGSDLAKATPDRIIAAVREADADILGFQEVSASHAQIFSDILREEYPYQISYAAGESTLGLALLSRYPIVQDEAFFGEIDFVPYMDAMVDVNGTEINILNVHPAPPIFAPDLSDLYRSRGINDARLFAERATTGFPTLLLGDLNATDQSQEYDILSESLTDVFYEKGRGFGFTYPINRPYGYTNIPSLPVFRIDYVWHTGHFVTLEARTGINAGSDHLPVVVRLALNTD